MSRLIARFRKECRHVVFYPVIYGGHYGRGGGYSIGGILGAILIVL
jgi:hypothetical protein